jgi:hypothetical protein
MNIPVQSLVRFNTRVAQTVKAPFGGSALSANLPIRCGVTTFTRELPEV